MKRYWIALLPLISFDALGQTRCDCTPDAWQGDCRATATQGESFIRITTSTNQCARVDWYSNGEPFTTIVTDGEDFEEWLGSPAPSLVVQSCKVCADGAAQNRQLPNDEPEISSSPSISLLERRLTRLSEIVGQCGVTASETTLRDFAAGSNSELTTEFQETIQWALGRGYTVDGLRCVVRAIPTMPEQ